MIRGWASHFITLEGIEGVGKSTQTGFIADYLREAGVAVVVTREPGGTRFSELLRDILLDPNANGMTPETETLLMFAARADHVNRIIRPALSSGQCVISDRFTDATYAYQGRGRKVNEKHIKHLERFVHPDVVPHLTFLLDAPPSVALARTRERGRGDRFERERIEFFTRVRAGYLKLARQHQSRIRVIDASGPIQSVRAHIVQTLHEAVPMGRVG